MPMVRVDPALVLCYRDEYKQTLGDKRGAFHVMLVHEWLPAALGRPAPWRSAVSRGTCLATVQKSPRCRAHLRNGPLSLPALARSLRRQRRLLRHGRHLRA